MKIYNDVALFESAIENLNSVETVLKNYTRIKVSDNVGANRICKFAPYVSHCFRLRI